jgi:hypothetical protein
MEMSHYRREYATYHTAAERARYEQFAGTMPSPRIEVIRERYVDLWTLAAVAALHKAREETPAQFETERADLYTLAGATGSAMSRRAREVSDELTRCESASRLESVGRGGAELARRARASPQRPMPTSVEHSPRSG